MDAATLDRFAVVAVEIDEQLETELCKATGLDGGRVQDVLDHVRHLRRSAESQNMRVIVSPRASVGMCKMLNAGLSWNTANEAMVLKGMSSADRLKLGA
jgi:cobaltochelatase CobS